MVPVISTVSGTILRPMPPLMLPMVTTAGEQVRLALRLTTVCAVDHLGRGDYRVYGVPGHAAMALAAVTLILSMSLAAVVAPVRQLI